MSTKQAQAAFRKRNTQKGLKEYRNIWGYPEDERAVKEVAAELKQKREGKQT